MKSGDPRTWMWTEACQFLEQAERLQRQFFQPGAGVGWQPPVDIFETDDAIAVQVALPGVEPERVQVLIRDGIVTVRGERFLPVDARDARVHRLEIPHGRFERRIALPSGRYQIGRRDLSHGCLTLVLHRLA